ncbi:MAG: hypothetical protein IPN32_15080 [Deltaproteobacteria bacterium]|nr:hypothetical protein [Deltaproteobacteria bacterium]
MPRVDGSAALLAPLVLACSALLLACTPPARVARPKPPAASRPQLVDAAAGASRITVQVRDHQARAPAPSIAVDTSCGGTEAFAATGDDGLATFVGLPNGECVVGVHDPAARHARQLVLVVPRGGEALLQQTVFAASPRVAPRGPATALPPDVALRVTASGCLGSCLSYELDVDEHGRVHGRDDDTVHDWRLDRATLARARRQARRLADGPSYDAQAATDGRWRHVAVRVGDAVAFQHQYSHDFRLPPRVRALARRLERTLRIHQHLGRTSERDRS